MDDGVAVKRSVNTARERNAWKGCEMSFWDRGFDLVGARDRVADDMGQDWVRDPIYRSDILKLVGDDPELLTEFFRAGEMPRRGMPVPVPKSGLTMRPAVDLRTIDRIAFQVLVEQFSVDLLAGLPDFVCGWRYDDDPEGPEDLLDNSSEWRRYQRLLEEAWDEGPKYVLATDIAGFFQNIPHGQLRETLRSISSSVRNRLFDYLSIWQPSQAGIPQRVLASSLIANIYLEPVDEILADYQTVRWMDDIVIFCNSRREGVEAVLRIQEALQRLNLFLNAQKTVLLPYEEADSLLQFMKFRAIEYQLNNDDQQGEESLEETWNELLTKPEIVDRTAFSFCVSRFDEHKWEEPAIDVLRLLSRLPHVSDHASRYLRGQLDDPGVLKRVHSFLRGQNNQFRWQEYRLATLFWHAERLTQDQLEFIRGRAKSSNTYWAARSVYFRVLGKHGKKKDARMLRNLAEGEGNLEIVRGLIIGAAESGELTARELREMGRDAQELQVLVKYLVERNLEVPGLNF